MTTENINQAAQVAGSLASLGENFTKRSKEAAAEAKELKEREENILLGAAVAAQVVRDEQEELAEELAQLSAIEELAQRLRGTPVVPPEPIVVSEPAPISTPVVSIVPDPEPVIVAPVASVIVPPAPAAAPVQEPMVDNNVGIEIVTPTAPAEAVVVVNKTPREHLSRFSWAQYIGAFVGFFIAIFVWQGTDELIFNLTNEQPSDFLLSAAWFVVVFGGLIFAGGLIGDNIDRRSKSDSNDS